METESSILNVDQERVGLNRFVNFVKNAMKSAKLTTVTSSDTKNDDKGGELQEDSDDPDIYELLNSPRNLDGDSDRFSNLRLSLSPCEARRYIKEREKQFRWLLSKASEQPLFYWSTKQLNG